MSSNTGAASPPPKRRRRRPAKSCEQCRRRKIRCDQEYPCSACIRARAEMQCEYRDTDEPVNHQPRRTEASAGRRQQQQQPTPPVHHDRPLTVLSHVSPEAVSAPSIPDLAPSAAATAGSTVSAIPPILPISSSVSPVIPRLRNLPEKTKLFGQTHWLHTAEKFPVSGRFDPVEVEPNLTDAQAGLTDNLKEIRKLRFALKAQYSVDLEAPIRDLFGTLPPKAVCDELIQCYLRTLEPLYRILYLPCFWRQYSQLWETSGSTTSVIFLTKLTLILALGTTFYTPSDEAETDQLHEFAQTWLQNAQWWLTGPSEKKTFNLDGLQVFCLLTLARQTTFNCPGAASWLSTGSLLRMAITMGLHRSSKLFPTLSLFQRQYRSRLWATVLELSVQTCLDLALPLHLSPGDYDTDPPLNYNDADLESSSIKDPAASGTFTDSTLQVLLSKSLPLRIEVVRLLNKFRTEQSYDRALEIGAELRASCREIAAFFNTHKMKNKQALKNATLRPAEFHRKLMDIHIRRFNLFLYRDFMLHARTDPRFYLARKLCVESSMVIISASKGSDLGVSTKDLDDFAKLSAVGRGVYKCALSLDALIILALEIIIQLGEEAAPQAEADALDEMAKVYREPLIQALEDANDQLKHLLARGTTSLKRMLFVGTYLAQIRAMQAGRPAKKAIYEAIAEMVPECLAVMREKVGSVPEEPVETGEMLSTDAFSFDFAPGDLSMGWDFSDLLNFPALNENGQGQWPAST